MYGTYIITLKVKDHKKKRVYPGIVDVEKRLHVFPDVEATVPWMFNMRSLPSKQNNLKTVDNKI